MIEKVFSIIEKNDMIQTGDKVIVAVSGGPDSLCLLHILNKLKDQLGITIVVAHVNHCLRGKDADEDQEFVHSFSSALGLECYSKKIDINKLSKEEGISGETAGRKARYDFFSELYARLNATKVALAHNANDQAETVLMRIMRGTGLDGLAGIKPVRDGIYIRPLLEISREEIESYCSDNNIKTRLDKTNLENIYSRNKIRLELIPYIKENFNSDIVNTLNRLAQVAKKDNDFIEMLTDDKFKRYCNKKEGKVIINKEAFKEPEAVITRIIRKAVVLMSGNLYNFEMNHIYDIIKLHKIGTGKSTTLPGKVHAVNNYGDIIITQGRFVNNHNKYEYTLHINELNRIENIGLNITLRLIHVDFQEVTANKSNVKYFDYNKIKGEVIVRNRREGDKFRPIGLNGSKKLKDILIDLKISKDQRENIPLICFGGDIAWITGYRISEKYKVDKNTKIMLEIKLESEEKK